MAQRISIVIVALALVSSPGWLRAQESSEKWRVEGALSAVRFTESEWHLSPGVSASYRLTPRLELGGELAYLYASESDQDVVLVSRLSYELAEARPLVPYVVGSVGILWNRALVGFGVEGPPGVRPYWATDPWISGGLGIRARVTNGFHLAPEAQIAYPLAVAFALRLSFPF